MISQLTAPQIHNKSPPIPEVLKDSLIKKKWGENEVFYPQEIKK
jgi:hypothetical protein